jgi:hypothetical protein
MTKTAVLTIVRNEPFFLRLWANYYCSQFNEDDVYVIDNGSSDDSIKNMLSRHPRIRIIDMPTELAFDHIWLLRTVEAKVRELLMSYDVVIFAEGDEFLIPDKIGLNEYCERFHQSNKLFLRARGYYVVHQIDSEPHLMLNDGDDILEHRSTMFASPRYNKTLITKVPLSWGRGFHYIYDNGVKIMHNEGIEPDLSMLHAQRIDLNSYYERVLQRHAKLKIKEPCHGSTDLDEVKLLFRTNSNSTDNGEWIENEKLSVPSDWKGRLIW